MKKIVILCLGLLLSLLMSACSLERLFTQHPNTTDSPLTNPSDLEKDAENDGTNDKNGSDSTTQNPADTATSMPKQKEITVYVEGTEELRPAKLVQSDQSDYAFYLLENYGFDAEEPNKDILYSKYDDSFFVRIEKLDPNTDLRVYKLQMLEAYQTLGETTEIDPSTLFSDAFKNSDFCFITEASDSSGIKTSIMMIAKTYGIEKFTMTFFLPLKEANEGISPSFWAMLSTLELLK